MSSAGVVKRGSATTVRACDSCRQKKRKCAWLPSATSCTYCLQLKEECKTTYTRRQRTKPQKRDRAVEYERRIQDLEALLNEQSATQAQILVQPLLPANDTVPLSDWVDNLRTEIDAFPAEQLPDLNPTIYDGPIDTIGLEPLPADAEDLTNDTLEDTLLGPSDEFEPSADFEEAANLLQDPSYQTDIPFEGLSLVDPFPSNAPVQCASTLPPPQLGAALFTEFLVDINTCIPLYRPSKIAEHLRICYIGASDGTAVAWASAYIVIGLAYRTRGMSAVANAQDDQLADYYLHRAMGTVSGLLLAPPTLDLVQCLLGLAILIRSSSLSSPHALFVSTALRIAQSLAYENDDAVDSVRDDDVDQQRRVFWLALMQDTDDNMISNAPTSHQRDDTAVRLPADDPSDTAGTVTAAEGSWKVNLFVLRVRLVCLQAEAIEHLFSLKVRRNSQHETTAKAKSLIERLHAWHVNELFQLGTQELALLLYRSDVIHVLNVEASFFATIFRLHSFLILGSNPRANPFSTDVLAELAMQKEHPSYKEAARVLSLLSVTPHDEIGICGMIKRSVVAALVTVLSYHLHSVEGQRVPPSSDCMKSWLGILRTLGMLVEKSEEFELGRSRDLCMMLSDKLETKLRVKWLQDRVDNGGDGASGAAPLS